MFVKKMICGVLTASMLFSASAMPKAEAGFGGFLGSVISSIATSQAKYQQEHYVHSWARSADLQIGNGYKGELPSEAYRQKFSVKGTSYLYTIENKDFVNPGGTHVFSYPVKNELEHVTAAFNNGASYYLETKGKKKVLQKTLEIDGFKYEKNKRVNDVADDSGHEEFGINEYSYLYKDSLPYVKDKEMGRKLPVRCNLVKLLGKEYIAEVYKYGGSDKIEHWYFFDVNTKELKMMAFNFYNDEHELKLSRLRNVIAFSTEIPDMSVFEIPKKYQKANK